MDEDQYFGRVHTIEAVKKLYRSLAQTMHPDHGGTDEGMKALNAHYTAKLKSFDGTKSRDADGKERTYNYNMNEESAVMAQLFKLFALKLQGIQIELIGTWIWVTGDTKPNKDALKGAGCKWHNKREVWFWSYKPWGGRASKGSLASLARKYGSTSFDDTKISYAA